MPQKLTKPAFLAGGLSPGNVCAAIVATMPWGVDVSSGIEVEPGIKDGDRMRTFVEEVRRADCHVEPDVDNDTASGNRNNGFAARG
jgi:phosphoribosylanthranilate isomerase